MSTYYGSPEKTQGKTFTFHRYSSLRASVNYNEEVIAMVTAAAVKL